MNDRCQLLNRLYIDPRKLINTAKYFATPSSIAMVWADSGSVANNWGDKLNPYLAQSISGHKAVHKRLICNVSNAVNYHYWVGSHLLAACRDPQGIVWGAGFIDSKPKVRSAPRKIYAVRGWLSFEVLRKHGIYCPYVVGDPALLMPRLYSPHKIPRTRLGIIPHYREQHLTFFQEAGKQNNIRLINILAPIEQVVDEIYACDIIFSSSLHGLICADAYRVPSLWIKASDLPLGDGFKYLDYLSTTARRRTCPVFVSSSTRLSSLEEKCEQAASEVDLDALWRSYPIGYKTRR